MFNFQYIYGPVYSWRLGRSLGVDPLSAPGKICNMDCIYCQLGRTSQMTNQRRQYISAADILNEIKHIPLHFVDYITFSGRGEPTLASNLGGMIRAVKQDRHEKVAVITNGLLLNESAVRHDLMAADFVLIKLDAGNQKVLECIDGACGDFTNIVEGIKIFRHMYKGKIALQIMVLKENMDQMKDIAQLARQIAPQEIQLNTPLRPSGSLPVDRAQMDFAKRFFKDMTVVTVFDSPSQEYTPLDEASTIRRHGNFRKTRCHI